MIRFARLLFSEIFWQMFLQIALGRDTIYRDIFGVESLWQRFLLNFFGAFLFGVFWVIRFFVRKFLRKFFETCFNSGGVSSGVFLSASFSSSGVGGLS